MTDWAELGEIEVSQNWTYSNLTTAEWFKFEQVNFPPGKGLIMSQWDGDLLRVQPERLLSGAEPQTFHLPVPETLNPSRKIGFKLTPGNFVSNWKVRVFALAPVEPPPPDPTEAIATQFPSVPTTRRNQVLTAATAAANGQAYSVDDVLATLATLAHWWQCSDTDAAGVSVGMSVQTINPYIGSISLTQANVAAQATLNSDGLNFVPGKSYVPSSALRFNAAPALTLLAVVISGGVNLQSVFRFQEGSSFIVLPWGPNNGSSRFIVSSDRATVGPKIQPPPTDGPNILIGSWKRNAANGFYIRNNGAFGEIFNGADVSLPSDTLTVGSFGGNGEFLTGKVQSLAIATVQYSTVQLTQLERFFNAYNGFSIF